MSESHHTREPLKMEFEWVEPILSSKEKAEHPYPSKFFSPRIFTNPRRNSPPPLPLDRMYFRTPTVSTSTPAEESSPTTIGSSASSRSSERYQTLTAAAIGRHIPKVYTVIADQTRDDLIDEIMASPTVTETLAKFERRTPRMTETDVVLLVAEVGNKFRTELIKARGQASESYGKPIPRRGIVKEDEWRSSKGFETVEIEIIQPEVMFVDSDVEDGCLGWSKYTTLIEVRRDWRKDTISDRKHPMHKGLGYCRWILARSPMRSHLHFVTWCGHLVRLWYFDAAHFGCSAAYSVKDPEHRRDIGRILFLLMSEECRGILSGRWNPGKDIASHLSDGTSLSGIWTEPLQPLTVREELFGSRTAIFTSSIERPQGGIDGDDATRLFLKCSWRHRALLDHELTMQQRIAGLPGAPSPIGRPVIPASAIGFKEETAVVQQDDASVEQQDNAETQQDHGRDLVFDVLLYKHRLGHSVKPTVEEKSLFRLHLQLAEQLLGLSERGFHYRDFNQGNFLVQHNTDDVLVLVDHGNMRQAFGPRSDHSGTSLDEAIEAARDDVKSANPCFLSHARSKFTSAEDSWKAGWSVLSFREEMLIWREASLEKKVEQGEESLLHLRKTLCKMLINSHRYVDDLESAMYLHVWQGAEKSGWTAGGRKTLEDQLGDRWKKVDLWENSTDWWMLVALSCRKMSRLWQDLMIKLRKIICKAQEDLRKELSQSFEQMMVNLSDLQPRLRIKFTEPEASFDGVVKSLWSEAMGPFPLQNEEFHPIERACFVEVMEELRKAAEASGAAVDSDLE